MTKTKLVLASILAVAVFSIAMAPIAPSAFAAVNGAEWGKATSNFAPLGEHSRPGTIPADGGSGPGFPPYDVNPLTGEPDKPGRIGLGNILNGLFNGDWCEFLAALTFPCA